MCGVMCLACSGWYEWFVFHVCGICVCVKYGVCLVRGIYVCVCDVWHVSVCVVYGVTLVCDMYSIWCIVYDVFAVYDVCV